jgi:hypothetical protein
MCTGAARSICKGPVMWQAGPIDNRSHTRPEPVMRTEPAKQDVAPIGTPSARSSAVRTRLKLF